MKNLIAFICSVSVFVSPMCMCLTEVVDAEESCIEYNYSDTLHISDPLVAIEEPEFEISERDIIILAKLMYGECRGISDNNMKAAVCWVALNRLDHSGYGNTLEDVVIRSGHFSGYKESNPVWDNLYELAKDVMYNYYWEKAGWQGSWRVIPEDYLWFHGNGEINIFRNAYRGGQVWDWSTNYYD